MKRKYLDDIGCTSRFDTWDLGPDRERREKEFKEQRDIYGFDERETWNLNETFLEFLYERLMMYIEIGGGMVNLNFHKFKFRGKEYTQLELLNIMLDDLKHLITTDEDEYFGVNTKKYKQILREIPYRRNRVMDIWKLVFPAMWW